MGGLVTKMDSGPAPSYKVFYQILRENTLIYKIKIIHRSYWNTSLIFWANGWTCNKKKTNGPHLYIRYFINFWEKIQLCIK